MPVIEQLHVAWTELTADGAPFAMTPTTVRGIPMRVFTAAPPNLRVLWELAAGRGDVDYIVYEDEHYTYGEIADQVRWLAHHLRDAHGVGSGDRVAIAMRNYPEWVVAYWATLSIGAAVVGMNAWWTGAEMAFGLTDSRPKVLIADGERIERVLPSIDSIRADGRMGIIAVRYDGTLPADAERWSDVARGDQAPASLPAATIEPDDDACIFYTSGTTGFPKGAQLTHRGCITNIMHLGFWAAVTALAAQKAPSGTSPVAAGATPPPAAATPQPAAATPQPATPTSATPSPATPAPATSPLATAQAPVVLMAPTPLFHVTANNCLLHPATLGGAKIVFTYKWDPARALELIERERVTNFSGVPTMSRELLAHPDWQTRDTSSLTGMGGGGAALQPDLVAKIDKSLPNGSPSTGYGLTETHGIVTANSAAYFLLKPASCGPVMPTFDCKLVDDDGHEVPNGSPGQLCVRGPAVIKGYLNRPDATAENIPEGWFNTGDIAVIDDDRFVFIVDRAKDMVLRGGENVYCSEVETAIYAHGDVAEVAVFGVPDERLGEEVGAAIVLSEGASITEDELRAFLSDTLAKHKLPARVWFLDTPLPRNANGKFVKRELRNQLLGL